MKTLYEILNVDLAQEYTKARKFAKLTSIAVGVELEIEAKAVIDAMDIPNDDDRYHWIQTFGRIAGADLLTLGKVQPENMLKMASLESDDFKEAVKVATSSARNWNQHTIAAEKELNAETLPNTMV
jgi:hypothetical protein